LKKISESSVKNAKMIIWKLDISANVGLRSYAMITLAWVPLVPWNP